MGCTPLLKATSQGATDTVQMLLDAGCYIDVQDEHGNAAIHEACWNGFSQTAELLVKYNCNVCLVNKAGFTALHLAAQNGHNECSRVLLYAGCNPDIKNNYGDTALHTAARYGHAGVTRILISARCKISEQNKNGDTALHIAAALKRRKIAKILVESGIDTELDNKQHEKAIDVAKRKEYPEIILIITSYLKPKLPPGHRFNNEQIGITIKEPVTTDNRLEFCPEDESLHKHEPKVDKQQKERRFFFFKKKKNIEKATAVPVGSYKKPGTGHEKPAVQGFFSHYVPRDGVQFYRDLAGNIKQGPIGYAPVCQCGPSLRRLENNITDTRESLQKHINTSHHLLSQRIDNLDIRTNQQAYATEVLINDRLQNEKDACHGRITERLQEERQENQTRFNQANENIKEELEYWLNDRLASYGHCLDHHHDDSALPPRNLFVDFPTSGRLIRSRSDETLSASDCSGKFRKKDFYASRKAAMQHIRGWDVAAFGSFGDMNKSRYKERNNNVIAGSNKVVTHALTQALEHTAENLQNCENEHDAFNSGKNLIPSPGNLTPHYSNTEKTGIMSRGGNLPWKQNVSKTAPEKDYINKKRSRVTFSKDQQKQHLEQSQHHSLSASLSLGNSHNQMDQVNQSRQNFRSSAHVISPASQNNMGHSIAPAIQHSNWSQQNLPKGGPPNTGIKSSELGDSHKLLLTGRDKLHINKNSGFQSYNQKLADCEGKYSSRTLSTDSLLNESSLSYSRNIARCHSVENALDGDSETATAYNSGYLTDTAIKHSSTGSSSQVIDSRSLHPASTSLRATHRYRLPETSTSQDDALFGLNGAPFINFPQQSNISFKPAIERVQSPTYFSTLNQIVDPDKEIMALPMFKHSLREHIQPASLYKRVNNLDNKNTDRSESENDCLQHDILVNSSTIAPPAYAQGNKEDSTCSSNQDSGYHGQGLKRGIDTSGGTPSSSFSAERSGCNTPSNTDSPYITHSELSNDRMKTSTNNYHISTNPKYGNECRLSSDIGPNKNINSHSSISRGDIPYTGSNCNNYNSDVLYVNSNSKVPSYGNVTLGDVWNKVLDSTHQSSSICYDKLSHMPPPSLSSKPAEHGPSSYNSNRYSHTGCDSNTHLSAAKLLLGDTSQDYEEKAGSQRSGNYTNINERLIFQQSGPNNYKFSFKEDQEVKPSNKLNEQVHKPVLACSDNTSVLKQVKLAQNTSNNNSGHNQSNGRTNSQQQTSEDMSQVAIQAHIQGWYQRKLIEAADRLKQNHSCSQRNSEQYSLRNEDNYFQKQNVVSGKQDFHCHLSDNEKPQDVANQTFSPRNNFQTLSSAQKSHLHQFQSSANKSSYFEHQNPDSPRISGLAVVSQQRDLYPRVPFNDRNSYSSSRNAPQVPSVDQSYDLTTGTYIKGKQAATYTSVFYDSVQGSDV
ncbi:unnamed protein product [Candidula unifasciata]|uniref:Ankyrin repeat domain-containing protein 6 n=1 Tax=Candidula unifasciata TaxID=100452 RepID=A0A8S3Z8V1_9EUPU|nr:unnamed protein product [Candidula unifasciata]